MARNFNLDPLAAQGKLEDKQLKDTLDLHKQKLEASIDSQTRNLEIELFESFKKSIEKLNM